MSLLQYAFLISLLSGLNLIFPEASAKEVDIFFRENEEGSCLVSVTNDDEGQFTSERDEDKKYYNDYNNEDYEEDQYRPKKNSQETCRVVHVVSPNRRYEEDSFDRKCDRECEETFSSCKKSSSPSCAEQKKRSTSRSDSEFRSKKSDCDSDRKSDCQQEEKTYSVKKSACGAQEKREETFLVKSDCQKRDERERSSSESRKKRSPSKDRQDTKKDTSKGRDQQSKNKNKKASNKRRK